MTATDEMDAARSEAFSEKLIGILNGGALSLMISIGHRTGLFDAMAKMEPAGSEQIASQTDLNERYVREWLGAMVTGGIVEYDAGSSTYALPREHAASLTRAAGPDNVAAFTQYISLLGAVEDPIVTCFRAGGGVPYSAYPRFHEVMAEDSHQTVVCGLRDAILPLVPGLTERLRDGIDVLDVGCGSGRAMLHLAQEFPLARFTGYDFSDEAVTAATTAASDKGLSNVSFAVRDVAALDETARYDLVTAFDAIHDQAAPAQVLAGIRTALRPGGTFLMQDIAASSHVEKNIDHPLGAFLYTISCMHCMTVSLALGGAGLGTCWGREKALEMLREAGFGPVEVHTLPHDAQNHYYVTSPA